MSGEPVESVHERRPAAVAGPTALFVLAVLVASAIAVYQITVAMGAVTPGGGEPTRIPLSPGQTVIALSFILWPALAVWGALRRSPVVVWTATGVYMGIALVLGLSFGGHHLFYGVPLMLAGAVWQTLSWRGGDR